MFECGIGLELREVVGAFVDFEFEKVSHRRGGGRLEGCREFVFKRRGLLLFISCSRKATAVVLVFVGSRVLADRSVLGNRGGFMVIVETMRPDGFVRGCFRLEMFGEEVISFLLDTGRDMAWFAFDFLADGSVLPLVKELFDALLHFEGGVGECFPPKEIVGSGDGIVLI